MRSPGRGRLVLKRVAVRFLVHRSVNAPVRCVAAAARRARLISDRTLIRIPVRADYSLALPNGTAMRVRTDGTDAVSQVLYWKGVDGFEPETLAVFLQLVRGSGTVLDVGAHTGLYGVAAALADPTVRVVSFEPVRELADRVEEAAQLNGLTNLEVVRAAVSDTAGDIELILPPFSGHLPTGASTAANVHGDGEHRTVVGLTVDQYVDEHGIGSVGVIKIDTETTEDRVLRGARATIERHRPMIVCEILRHSDSMQSILDELRYRAYWITDDGLALQAVPQGDPAFRFLNYLLVAEDRVSELAEQGFSVLNPVES